jgi:hypothetical protein
MDLGGVNDDDLTGHASPADRCGLVQGGAYDVVGAEAIHRGGGVVAGAVYCASVVVSMHVATGAAAGAALGSRVGALATGPLLHFVCDVVPHQDIESRRFEIASGLALLALVAAVRGPLDPAVIGGVTASAPDLEHVLPLPRRGGRKLFPTHRFARLHRTGGVPAWLQLVTAGAIVGATIGTRIVTR